MKQPLRKQLLSLLLVLVMLVSFCPAGAFADEGQAEDPAEQAQLVNPAEETDPAADEDPAWGIDPVEGEDPATSEDPIEGEDPVEGEDSVEGEDPVVGEDPIEGEDPVEGEDPIEGEDSIEGEENAEGENPEGEETDELVRLRFVSAQALTLTLVDAAGETVLPVEDLPAEALALEEPAAEALSAEESAAEDLHAETAEVPEDDVEFSVYDEAAEGEGFAALYLLAPGSYRYTAEAEGFYPLKDVELEVTEEMNGATVTVTLEVNPLPCGFPGMPKAYELTDEEILNKLAMTEHDVPGTLAALTPGVDYVDGEVFFLAADADYAKLVAEAYHAELDSFEHGVAILKLRDASVLEAVTAGADPALPLPPVSPNYIGTLAPEDLPDVPMLLGGKADSAGDSFGLNSRKSWEYWRDMCDENFDPYLQDPNAASEDGEPSGNHYQYMHELINSFEAWGVTRGAGVTVAVIDSGVADHEDLGTVERAVVNSSFDRGASPNLNPSDRSNSWNHGTHVAGIIAGRLGNGKGGAGVAPEASLLSLQVMRPNSAGNPGAATSDIIKALRIAQGAGGVKVINMSIGGKTWNPNYEKVVRDVIEGRDEESKPCSKIVICASTGNDASNIMNYPGTFDIPGLIAVGAVTRGSAMAGYSNYGPWQDIAAPGSDIWSTVQGSFASWSGTSMATPVVSGACALYLSIFPDTTPAEMEEIIKDCVTNGVLDLSKLFVKDTAAPKITIEGLDGGHVPYGAQLSISAKPGDTILYTLNGEAPELDENGQPEEGSELYLGPVPLDRDHGAAAGKKMTVKAVRVTGLGTVSKLATLSFTLGYQTPTAVVIAPASYLIAGKSVTLRAVVTPVETANQTVIWQIVSKPNAPAATINPSTGRLSTSSRDKGTITIQASTVSGLSSDAFTIELKSKTPVKKLTLTESAGGPDITKLTLYRGAEEDLVTKQLFVSAIDEKDAVYTDANFSWSSSNQKVATVSPDGLVTVLAKGTTVITCKVMDGSGVSDRCTITVRQHVQSLALSGSRAMAPGKRIVLRAKVKPSNANVKTLSWSIDPDSLAKGVTIKDGLLHVPKDYSGPTTITVTAATTDGSNISVSYPVRVTPSATVTVKPVQEYGGAECKTNKDGSLQSVTLFSAEQAAGDSARRTYAKLTAQLSVASEADILWTSSNPKVVSVTADSAYPAGRSATLQAEGAGSATITAKVDDSEGRSFKFTVKVINPVSSVTVVSSAPTPNDDNRNYTFSNGVKLRYDRLLGYGKSAKNRAVLGDAYGKPSEDDVTWKLAKVEVYSDDGSRHDDIVSKIEGLITVNKSSGTISTSAKLQPWLKDGYDIFATVRATTTDGTEISGDCVYFISGLTTKIGFKPVADGKYIVWDDSLSAFKLLVGCAADPWTIAFYQVTSSNTDAGTAMMRGNYLLLYPNFEKLPKNGNPLYTTIKLTACDGSGASVSVRFRFDCSGNVNTPSLPFL